MTLMSREENRCFIVPYAFGCYQPVIIQLRMAIIGHCKVRPCERILEVVVAMTSLSGRVGFVIHELT